MSGQSRWCSVGAQGARDGGVGVEPALLDLPTASS